MVTVEMLELGSEIQRHEALEQQFQHSRLDFSEVMEMIISQMRR